MPFYIDLEFKLGVNPYEWSGVINLATAWLEGIPTTFHNF